VSEALVIRDARAGDEATIHALLKAMSEFEKLTHIFDLTPEIVARDFIGEHRRVQCEIAEWDGVPAGLTVWFRFYATFRATSVLHLEDLYVDPKFRRRGIGRAFLKRLAQRAVAEGAVGIGWYVLDWNSDAIAFYESIGAPIADEWRICRLSGDALAKLAGPHPEEPSHQIGASVQEIGGRR
jgi:GNAT superfamily N-acetyltransferase